MLSPRRAEGLRPTLDRFVAGFDARARIGFDPVELPRRYPDPGDAEVAGLLAASLAYGRADLFKPALERAIRANKPVVIDVYMKNEPVPTAGHWNIMDIYSPGKRVHHVSTGG